VNASKQATIQSNIAWFNENDHYMETQSRLRCYQNIQRIVESEIRGVGKLLDIGNGGFFNYDTALAEHVTAVDLFLRDGPGPTPNSAFRGGSCLDLPFDGQSFDCILEQNVLHHVTGQTVAENHQNLRQCLKEMHRCLKPTGKVVLIESTVNRLFNLFENVAYRPALWLKRGGHPVTYQFTPAQILRVAQDLGFVVREFSFVPRGLFVLQFGYRWPSLLTPARPIKLVLTRAPAIA
jgi:SAM-dependent methyltransferase